MACSLYTCPQKAWTPGHSAFGCAPVVITPPIAIRYSLQRHYASAVAVVIDKDPPLLATAACCGGGNKMVIRALCEAQNLEVQSRGRRRGRRVRHNGLRYKYPRIRGS